MNESSDSRSETRPLTVRVPASTSNLGPGFDCAGAALDRFLTVRIRTEPEPSPGTVTTEYTGTETPEIPPDRDLIVRGVRTIYNRVDRPVPELHLTISSDIPVSRGLGASGAAVIAGLTAGNSLAGDPLSRGELFREACRIEGHPDNVAPSLHGGVTLAVPDANGRPICRNIGTRLPDLYLVVPDLKIETERARAALPETVPMTDAVNNLSRTGLLVYALIREEWDLLPSAMVDRLHEQARLELIPGGRKAIEAGQQAGALATWVSGAGPTLGCFVQNGNDRPARKMAGVLSRHDLDVNVHRSRAVPDGAQILNRSPGPETD